MTEAKPLFELPEVDIYLSDNNLPERKTLLLLGGRPADTDWLRTLCNDNSPEIWAVDRGIDSCREAGLQPSLFIGDMDSASQESIAWAESVGVAESKHSSDKDLTDFQLAMMLWGIRNLSGASVLAASCCFGGRFDHIFSLLHTFVSEGESDKINLARCFADEREGVFFLYSGETARLRFKKKPYVVSLLPITESCKGVSLDGVHWPMNKELLKRKFPWSISNTIKDEPQGENAVNVKCGEGIAGLYWCNLSSGMI